MSTPKYDPELKKEVLRKFLEDGRTKQSLNDEYGLGQGTIDYWLKQYRKECDTNPDKKREAELHAEIKRLKALNAELDKENRFLKKAAAFFAKETQE